MKKIILLLGCFIVLSTSVVASGISFNIIPKNDTYYLEILDENNKKISYEEAINKYSLDEYIKMYHDGQYLYFYMGNSISEEEYNKGSANIEADNKVKELGEYAIRVHNTEDIIKIIQDIFSNYKNNEYYLVYSKEEYKTIDFQKIKNFLEENYLINIKQNIYKYDSYGLYQPMKFFPDYNDEVMIIDGQIIKTNSTEIKMAEEFSEILLSQLNNLSDYEKILNLTNYIKNTTKYVEDAASSVFIEGYLTPYDVLLDKKMVCIGVSTTLQYLFEKLGIESYIVDKVIESDELNETYSTIHTYNIVKLDGKWYILDILNRDGFLVGSKSSLYVAKDLKYLNIKLSRDDYQYNGDANLISFDYDKLNIEINKIKNQVVKEDKKEILMQDSNFYGLFMVILILIIIFLIIYIFTRKK